MLCGLATRRPRRMMFAMLSRRKAMAFKYIRAALLLCVIALAGCNHNLNYSAQLPPGTLALRKIPPEMYPSFATNPNDLIRTRPAIAHSLEYLAKPSSQAYYPYGDISHDRAVATLVALDAIAYAATQAPVTGDWINQQIRKNFEVYQS